MVENEFISTKYPYSIYNPSVWSIHPNNKYRLTLHFEMENVLIYYVFFEEYPDIKLQVPRELLKLQFKEVVEWVLLRLTEELENRKVFIVPNPHNNNIGDKQ